MIGSHLGRGVGHGRVLIVGGARNGAVLQAWASAIWAITVTIGSAPGRDDSAVVLRWMDGGGVEGVDGSGADVPGSGAGATVAHAAIQAAMPLPANTPWPRRQPQDWRQRTASRNSS